MRQRRRPRRWRAGECECACAPTSSSSRRRRSKAVPRSSRGADVAAWFLAAEMAQGGPAARRTAHRCLQRVRPGSRPPRPRPRPRFASCAAGASSASLPAPSFFPDPARQDRSRPRRRLRGLRHHCAGTRLRRLRGRGRRGARRCWSSTTSRRRTIRARCSTARASRCTPTPGRRRGTRSDTGPRRCWSSPSRSTRIGRRRAPPDRANAPPQALAQSELRIPRFTRPARSGASALLEGTGRTPADWQAAIDGTDAAGVAAARRTSRVALRAVNAESAAQASWNVAGLLPGTDPRLRDETILVTVALRPSRRAEREARTRAPTTTGPAYRGDARSGAPAAPAPASRAASCSCRSVRKSS